jgi:hypothetical protein
MVGVVDLADRKFARLTVLSRAASGRTGKARWTCQCDCGTEVTVFSTSLISGNTKSCGCLQRESAGARRRARTDGYRWDIPSEVNYSEGTDT